MTLSSPSSWAAAISASMSPKSSTEVASAALTPDSVVVPSSSSSGAAQAASATTVVAAVDEGQESASLHRSGHAFLEGPSGQSATVLTQRNAHKG